MIEPKLGMGVTRQIGSDSYPYTIVGIVNDRKIVVTADDISRNKATWPDQDYDYTSNPNGEERILTLRKGRRWRELGESLKGSPWYVGERRYYSDPHF